MKSLSGTYALILQSREPARVQVGRWGRLDLVPGYYIYVGSAFGPGGVRARVLRHCRRGKNRHWHLDYLEDHLTPLEAWCGYADRDLEHRWAQRLAAQPGMMPVEGFGCSDCRCCAHLFATATEPDFARFSRHAPEAVERRQLRCIPERSSCVKPGTANPGVS